MTILLTVCELLMGLAAFFNAMSGDIAMTVFFSVLYLDASVTFYLYSKEN